jgi:hypothetical protein
MRGTEAHLNRYGRYARIVRLVVWGRWEGLADAWQPDDTLGECGFAGFASRQHLAHYILRRLESEGKIGLFPEGVVAGLREVVERARARTGRIPEALGEVSGAFESAKIDCLMLKGAPFAVRYFGDPRLRQIYDIDLLVHRADADRALRVLLGLGYRPKPRRIRRAGEGPSIRPHRLRTEHALSLSRGGVSVDLHWRLRTAPAYRLEENHVWSGTQTMAFDGIRCSAPSDEYALVLLLLSIAHDIGRSACRLKHLLDVHQILRSEPGIDWDGFFERRRAENVLPICVNVLWIVLDLLGEEAKFPRLVAALARHEGLRAGPRGGASVVLLFRRGRRLANALWFASVYPVAWRRDLVWLLDRYLSHPGRVLLLPWKLLRAGYWSARHLLGAAGSPA